MHIEFHETIDSTQRRARELVERGDRRWDAICAAHQTAGRGRQGALWHDTPGQSLLVSLILWETPLPEPAGLIGLLAALATAQSLETRFPDLPPVQLKYPNDLMIHGRKLGGVLTELVEGVAIVGIGVNLEQTEFPAELQEKAISVRMAVRPQPPAPLSVYREGGTETPCMHGSPSPFTEREMGGEVQQAEENESAALEAETEPYTLISTGVSSTVKVTGEARHLFSPSFPTPSPASRERGNMAAPHALGSPLPRRGRGAGGEGSIELILPIHHNLTRLLDLWRTHPKEVFRLWQARDCSAGRAYRVLDLPDQPVGVALGVAPDFRLRLRLPDGAEHTTYYVSAV